jgi:hypothetical protein
LISFKKISVVRCGIWSDRNWVRRWRMGLVPPIIDNPWQQQPHPPLLRRHRDRPAAWPANWAATSSAHRRTSAQRPPPVGRQFELQQPRLELWRSCLAIGTVTDAIGAAHRLVPELPEAFRQEPQGPIDRLLRTRAMLCLPLLQWT